jgi:hypothetical protein
MVLSLVAALALPAGALAGPQFVDGSGFANSGHDVVAYFGLDQSPVGTPQAAAVPGKASITAEWNVATFAFASEENRDRFLADPAAYVPQYDGHCAFGVAKGSKVPGNPDLWRIVDGKLYLNVSARASSAWQQDIPGNLQMSEANWTGLEPQPAADGAIPDYTADAPVQ